MNDRTRLSVRARYGEPRRARVSLVHADDATISVSLKPLSSAESLQAAAHREKTRPYECRHEDAGKDPDGDPYDLSRSVGVTTIIPLRPRLSHCRTAPRAGFRIPDPSQTVDQETMNTGQMARR